MTADEFLRLVDAGIIGSRVELIDGALMMMGRYPLGFSHEQVGAAADIGVELPLARAHGRDWPAARRTGLGPE